jgi:hypothetical protein
MLTKALSIISLIGIVCSLSLTSLYLHTNSKLKLLQEKHNVLVGHFEECTESKGKLEESKKASEVIVVKQQEDLMILENKEQSLVEQLNNIPKKGCPKPPTNNPTKENLKDEAVYVVIDDPYDDNYLRVFKQLPNKDKRDSPSP